MFGFTGYCYNKCTPNFTSEGGAVDLHPNAAKNLVLGPSSLPKKPGPLPGP